MAFTEALILEALTISMSGAYTKGLGVIKPQWNRVATQVPSSGSSNFYGWLKDLPGIKEWVGERQLAEMGSHGYQIQNKTFEASIVIKREDVEDDQIGKYAVVAEGFGRDAAVFPDKNVYGLLAAGFSTLCYDGQNFFDTDHPMGTTPATTFSNVVGDPSTDTGAPWFVIDDMQIVKPVIFQERRPFNFQTMNATSEYTWFNNKFAAGVDGRHGYGFGFPQTAIGSKAELNEANFAEAKKMLGSMKKASGSPIGTMARVLVVGPSNESAARKLISREFIGNGESNIYFNNVEIVVSPYLP